MGSGVSHARPPGFTLVELLVVLAIMAGLFAMAPSVTAGIPGLRLRAEATQLAETLRRTHDDARRRGIQMAVMLLPAERRYAVLPDGASHMLAPAIDELAVQTASPLQPKAASHVVFFPDGSASAATIRLRSGSMTRTIVVHWLTGRVVVHD